MKDNRSSIKWIYKRTKSFLPSIILVALLSVFTAYIYVLLAYFSKTVIDGAKGFDHSLMFGSILLFAFIIIQAVFNFLISLLKVNISSNMNISLKNYMFTTLLGKKYYAVSEYHSGDLLNRFCSDVEQVVSGCVNIIPNLASMLTKIVAGIAAIYIHNYLFAFLVLAVGFIFPLIGRIIKNKYKAIHKQVQESDGNTRSFLQECFANIIVVKTFSGEKALNNKMNDFLKINKKFKIKRNIYSAFISTSLYLIFAFGYYGILVWGAVAVSRELLTVGTLIYFLQLVSMLRAPLQNISGVIPAFYSMLSSAERLIELEELEQEAKEIQNAEIFDFESILAQNLTFAYDNEIILKNCSFKINKNTITAITGESGCGKTTLFKLLLGLYDTTAGSITLDGVTPLNESTRHLFSYVPQGNLLLSGTIRENITLNDNSISEEKIIEAAKGAAIFDFISDLPDGFDTVISERGSGLSEGQIQRIAIARALIFDAPIILLDESTSALDTQTEELLLNNLKQYTDKTIIFITHRSTSLSVCDNVLKIENGAIQS